MITSKVDQLKQNIKYRGVFFLEKNMPTIEDIRKAAKVAVGVIPYGTNFYDGRLICIPGGGMKFIEGLLTKLPERFTKDLKKEVDYIPDQIIFNKLISFGSKSFLLFEIMQPLLQLLGLSNSKQLVLPSDDEYDLVNKPAKIKGNFDFDLQLKFEISNTSRINTLINLKNEEMHLFAIPNLVLKLIFVCKTEAPMSHFTKELEEIKKIYEILENME